MTTSEKLGLVHGVTLGILELPPVDFAGYVAPVTRLGIPALDLEDGPGGVGDAQDGVTDFPAPLALAATWDRSLARAFGTAVGEEQRAKGANVVLAPTVNVVRDPRWGRNFETFGEDPYLTARTGVGVIDGIQSNGVIAVVKHLAAYAEETARETGTVEVSDRTLHEIYLPPFEAAVTEAHAGGVMAAYNQVNGTFASQDASLLSTDLRTRWGFTGFTVSDWHGTHATSAAQAGLDLEMPDVKYFGDPLATAVAEGSIPPTTLDRMARDILTSMFAAGLFDHPPTGHPFATVTTTAHRTLAEEIEKEAIVLLQDRGGLLPLMPSVHSIAVVDVPVTFPGNPPQQEEKVSGCGSAYVNPNSTVSVGNGIARRAGPGVAVSEVNPTDPGTGSVTPARTAAAALAASSADVAVVVVHDDGCEDVQAKALQGSTVADRPDLSLPDGQDALVSAVAAANPHTVVVLETQGSVTMPWLDEVGAVLETWYGGEESGDALASVLFGDSDPSGRLPETFPVGDSQMPTAAPSSFPGVDGRTIFSEGIDTSYRYYAAHGITPLFPFGYGLSYTSFQLSGVSVSGSVSAGPFADGSQSGSKGRLVVTGTVVDTGHRAGSDVIEVYVGDPRSTGEPPRQLAAFARVSIMPGHSARFSVTVDARSLSRWDNTRARWVISPGIYTIMIGTSSAHIVVSHPVQVD